MLYPVLQDPLRPVVGSLFDRPVGVNIRQMLFGAGEQGGWYDVADMSTLFQDAAGTTPVTAVEQPVGRILDKSGRGNHATQATTTKRPVLSRRYNIIQNEGQFLPLDKYSCETTDSGSPVGVENNTLITAKSIPSAPSTNFTAGGSAIWVSMIFKQISPLDLSVGVRNATTSTMLKSGTVISAAGVPSPEAVALGNGWYKFSYLVGVGIAIGDNIQIYFGRLSASPEGASWRIAGITVVYASDAHLPYQWVNTATDYDADPAKFPAYLRFDGVDDALQTGNIDFTGTDKMTVWAGLAKDSKLGMVTELSTDGAVNAGGFYLIVNDGGGYSSNMQTNVANSPITIPGFASADQAVIALTMNIPGASRTIRRNSTSSVTSAIAGTGAFGDYPLYIGSRAGTSLYFNGRLYSLIVRGAQSSLSEIEVTELYIKQKMRLP